MTREEVVKWLKSLKREIGKTENRTLWHYAESIDMAIEALAERPTESDFISKAKVLETYSELYWFDIDCEVVSKAEVDKIYERLQSLPSAEVVLQTPQTYGKSINPNTEIVSDLISRQDALNMIIVAGECEPDLGYTHLHKVVENIPSAEPQWIPVSERLPDLKTEVIYSFDGIVSTGYMTDRDYNGEKTESHWEDLESGVTIEPTHWMPLPEPYKGGESDG